MSRNKFFKPSNYFSNSTIQIELVSQHSGFVIGESLSFVTHIQQLVKKVEDEVGFLF